MSTLKVNNLQDLGADAVVTNGVVARGALPSGSVLQVVSVTKTDVFTTSSTTFTAVTGLSASITPTSATSKILVFGMISQNAIGGNIPTRYRIMRNSTAIGIGDAAGSRDRATGFWYAGDVNGNQGTGQWAPNFLDSPATTSSVTYSIQVATSAGSIGINRSQSDADSLGEARTASTITLMEIAG